MENIMVRPFNQRIRIAALRGAFLVALPLLIFTRSAWTGTHFLIELFEMCGLFLIIAGVLGRFWSILYIGGRKNEGVMQDGPYSVCRHPLYLFSTVAVCGFAMMLGSFVLTVVLGGAIFAILSITASREEKYLRAAFGEAYTAYEDRVPRIWPKLSLFHSEQTAVVDLSTLRRNLHDALIFLSLIPLAELMEYAHDTIKLPYILVW